MTDDAPDLEAAVDSAYAQLRHHLESCPQCGVAYETLCGSRWATERIQRYGCSVGKDLDVDVLQMERRIIARNARLHGNLEHARRVERVIAQVEHQRQRRIDA
jgi:hypothetical protein